MYSKRHTQEIILSKQNYIIYALYIKYSRNDNILVISMQQCYIDMYKSHSENNIIYAIYNEYSVNDIKVLMYMHCLFLVDNPVHNR